MTDTIKPLIRRSPRYHVRAGSCLSITVSTGNDSAERLPAELLDVSVGGAKLVVAESITQTDLVIHIEAEVPQLHLDVPGEVRWQSPGARGAWRIGCAFRQSLPQHLLQELAEAQILDRRQQRRQEIALRADATWELTCEEASVRVIDYSSDGGFCLHSSTKGRPGDRILLRLETAEEEDVLVRGRARWQVETRDGFKIGCEFLNPQDSMRFHELLTNGSIDAAALPTEKPKHRRTMRRAAIGSIAAAAVLLLSAVLVGDRTSHSGSDASELASMMSSPTLIESRFASKQTSHTSPTVNEHHADALPVDTHLPNDGGVFHLRLALAPRNIALTRRVEMGLPFASAGCIGMWARDKPDVAQGEAWRLPGRSGAIRRDMASDVAQARSGRDAATPRRHREVEGFFSVHATVLLDAGFSDVAEASQQFQIARMHYDQGRFQPASAALRQALHYDPSNAFYAYVLALAQYRLELYDQAEQSVAKALDLEKRWPLDSWGRRMEPFQGRSRLWLEGRRRELRDS